MDVSEATVMPLTPETPVYIVGQKFRQRAWAALIDIIVISLLSFIGGRIFGILAVLIGLQDFILNNASFFQTDMPLSYTTDSRFLLINILGSIIYRVLFEWQFGATPGKFLRHMRVIRDDGSRCTFKAALLRSLLFPIDGFFFGAIAYAQMKYPLYQRLGDKLAGTLVVASDDPFIVQKQHWARFIAALIAFTFLLPPLLFSIAAIHNGLFPVRWERFSSTSGEFSVLMPGNPRVSTQKSGTPFVPIDVHITEANSGDETYGVSYFDFPANTNDQRSSDQKLNEALQSMLSATKATTVNQMDISMRSYPGRAVVARSTADGSERTLGIRAYLVGKRLYLQMAISSADRPLSADAEQFLDSFELAPFLTIVDNNSALSQLLPTLQSIAPINTIIQPPARQPFSSADGRFSVDMPGRPERTTHQIDSPAGTLEAVQFQVIADSVEYGVLYIDYPQQITDQADPSDLLDNVQIGVLQRIQATLIRQKDLTLEGYQGREIVAETSINGTKMLFQMRMYLVDNRLYQIIAGGPSGKFDDQIVAEFMDSFNITAP